MESIFTKIRYVICPKCQKLLIELGDVPIYQCGGCSTLLQAKIFNTLSSETSSLTLPGDDLSEYGPRSSEKQMSPSSSNIEIDSHQKGEPSEYGENEIKECSNTDQLDLGSNVESTVESQPNESIDTVTECFLNGVAEISSKLSYEVATNTDATISSFDDGSNGCVDDDHLTMSKASIDEQVLGSVEDEETGDPLLPIFQELLVKSSDENHSNRFGSHRGESSSRYRAWTRGTSINSVEFRSALNWMETEKDSLSRASSRDSAFDGDSLNYENGSASTKFKQLDENRVELLTMVDELRDQLSKLYSTREGKGRNQIRRTPHQHPLSFNRNYGLQFPHYVKSNSANPRVGKHFESRASMPTLYRTSSMSLVGQPHCSCLRLQSSFPHNGPCRACACCTSAQIEGHKLASLNHKERRKPSKRYCRPFSGGAPFFSCYKCSKLLQLPADFLESRGQSKKLRCGACFEILLFSFRSPDRSPIGVSSEIDSRGGTASGRESSIDRREDPFSGCVDYGVSFSNSNELGNFSREESGKQAPILALHRLMGYSSATELLYQPIDDDEGYGSREPTRQHSRVPSYESRIPFR